MLYVIIKMDWGLCEKEYLVHQSCFIENFYVMLLISGPPWFDTKCEAYNVLTLRCLGHVEPNK
jgi:hypothetical protein